MMSNGNLTSVTNAGMVPIMNDKQLVLIEVLQERMSDMIANMEKDPFYAPPKWSFENIWNALESLKHL